MIQEHGERAERNNRASLNLGSPAPSVRHSRSARFSGDERTSGDVDEAGDEIADQISMAATSKFRAPKIHVAGDDNDLVMETEEQTSLSSNVPAATPVTDDRQGIQGTTSLNTVPPSATTEIISSSESTPGQPARARENSRERRKSLVDVDPEAADRRSLMFSDSPDGNAIYDAPPQKDSSFVDEDSTLDTEHQFAVGWQALQSNARDAFRQMDVDGDGELTRDELQRALELCGCSTVLNVGTIMEEADADNTGTIDICESLAIPVRRHSNNI